MKKVLLIVTVAMLTSLFLSGCYNTKKRARQTTDNIQYVCLDGEDVLYFE